MESRPDPNRGLVPRTSTAKQFVSISGTVKGYGYEITLTAICAPSTISLLYTDRTLHAGNPTLDTRCITSSFSNFILVFRSSSHGEETLDDIFKTKSRAVFETEDDEDLFKTASTAEKRNVEEMSVDDIANYIQQNEADSNAKLDLF